MALTIQELIDRLAEFPPDWKVYATRQGSSLEVWEPGGPNYGYVFTDERDAKRFKSRRERRVETTEPREVVND